MRTCNQTAYSQGEDNDVNILIEGTIPLIFADVSFSRTIQE